MLRLGGCEKYDTGVSAMKQPCYQCPDRCMGCHGRCERYKEYKAEMEIVKRKRQEESAFVDAIMEAKRRRNKFKWNG